MLQYLRHRYSLPTLLGIGLLLFAFAFGGASRQHALRLAMVELAALPVLVVALARIARTDLWKTHRLALGLVAAIVALPLLQLIPLPPGLWMSLPGREQAVLALSIAGIQPGWTPISLTPDLTWRAFLALLPPVAMFASGLVISAEERRKLIYVVLAATAVSVGVGVLQLATESDKVYVWATTNIGTISGLFANRNHLASLLVAILPLVALTAASYARSSREQSKTALLIGALAIGLLIVAIGAIRSRAGVLLLGPSLVLSLIGVRLAMGRKTFSPAVLSVAAVAAAALVLVAALGLGPILERFDRAGAPEGRFEKWPIVLAAASTYAPVGSGLGSFDAVFRSVEPLDQLDATFFNQAHNDYLETLLEAGLAGVLLVAVFLFWFARRAWSAWRDPVSRFSDLRRAASVSVLMILVHSAGDYPLRTATMAVVFALLAAILEARDEGLPSSKRVRRRSKA